MLFHAADVPAQSVQHPPHSFIEPTASWLPSRKCRPNMASRRLPTKAHTDRSTTQFRLPFGRDPNAQQARLHHHLSSVSSPASRHSPPWLILLDKNNLSSLHLLESSQPLASPTLVYSHGTAAITIARRRADAKRGQRPPHHHSTFLLLPFRGRAVLPWSSGPPALGCDYRRRAAYRQER